MTDILEAVVYLKATGRVTSSRSSSTLPLDFSHLPPAYDFLAVADPAQYVDKFMVVGGALVPAPPHPAPGKTPYQERWGAYPPLNAQITMIWKALNELKGKPFSAEVEAMISQMAAIDAAHPDV